MTTQIPFQWNTFLSFFSREGVYHLNSNSPSLVETLQKKSYVIIYCNNEKGKTFHNIFSRWVAYFSPGYQRKFQIKNRPKNHCPPPIFWHYWAGQRNLHYIIIAKFLPGWVLDAFLTLTCRQTSSDDLTETKQKAHFPQLWTLCFIRMMIVSRQFASTDYVNVGFSEKIANALNNRADFFRQLSNEQRVKQLSH